MSKQLVEEGQNAINRMLASGRTSKHLWARQTLPRYRWNRNCWIRGFNHSAFSVYNSLGGVRRAGVATSDEDVIVSAHYGVTRGTEMRFVDPSGEPETHKVAEVITHPHYKRGPTICDLQVAKLATRLSSRIQPLRVLPEELLMEFPQHIRSRPGNETYVTVGLPMLGTDYEEKCVLLEGTKLHRFNSSFYHPTTNYDTAEVYFGTPISFGAAALDVTEPFISGDSSSPVVVIYKNQFCLVTVLTTSYAGTSIPTEFKTLTEDMGAKLTWA